MKGQNFLLLNPDTIQEAVQEYLDKRLAPPFHRRVCSVIWMRDRGLYEVRTQDKTEEESVSDPPVTFLTPEEQVRCAPKEGPSI